MITMICSALPSIHVVKHGWTKRTPSTPQVVYSSKCHSKEKASTDVRPPGPLQTHFLYVFLPSLSLKLQHHEIYNVDFICVESPVLRTYRCAESNSSLKTLQLRPTLKLLISPGLHKAGSCFLVLIGHVPLYWACSGDMQKTALIDQGFAEKGNGVDGKSWERC